MKKSVISVFTLFMALNLVPVISANAEYTNDFTLDMQTKQEIAEALDIDIKSLDSQEYTVYTPDSVKENPDVPITPEDFSPQGYDINSACEVYDIYINDVADKKDVNANCPEKPFYFVSFNNGGSYGEAILVHDESDSIVFHDSFIYAHGKPEKPENFDIERINSILADIDNVSDIKAYFDGMSKFGFVYFTSNGEEYIIPKYLYSDDTLKDYTVYSKDEFFRWLDEYIEVPDGGTGGGTLNSDKSDFVATPAVFEKSEEVRQAENLSYEVESSGNSAENNLPLYIMSACGTAVVVLSVLFLLKKKNT